MKTKPILIIASIAVVLLAGIIFYVKGRATGAKPNDEISAFLTRFNNHVIAGNTDSVLASFDNEQQNKYIKKFVNVLCGKEGVVDGKAPVIKIALLMDNAKITNNGTGGIMVTLPVNFNHDPFEMKETSISLNIYQQSPGTYKIKRVEIDHFIDTYTGYENFIVSKTLKDSDIYQPITLRAFKTAERLKAAYDTVVWFSHVKDQTYFYVVNGKWSLYDYGDATINNCKMGLVGPTGKVIIPVDYDLIHNVGDTFDGLVEVEKENKRGFYDLTGKIIVPVEYEHIYPVDNDEHLAALHKGDDFYWLNKDYTISEQADIRLADVMPTLKRSDALNIVSHAKGNLIECNSREEHASIYIAPSYLVDLGLISAIKQMDNPLRKNVGYVSEHTRTFTVQNKEKQEVGGADDNNWFTASFYAIRDYFIEGRSEFYDNTNVVIVDKKRNKLFTLSFFPDHSPDGSVRLEGVCNVNNIKMINDTLFEFKLGSSLYTPLYDTAKTLTGGPYYYYFTIKNNKLVELENRRVFGFTKYVKMTDDYLNACYTIGYRRSKVINKLTSDVLQFMKNEIYASYGYKFKDKRWQEVFSETDFYRYDDKGNAKYNTNVDDSLTVTDKYNINFINQKLNANKTAAVIVK